MHNSHLSTFFFVIVISVCLSLLTHALAMCRIMHWRVFKDLQRFFESKGKVMSVKVTQV